MNFWKLLTFVLMVNVFSAIFNLTYFEALFQGAQNVQIVNKTDVEKFRETLSGITQTQISEDIPQGFAMIWGFIMSIPILSQLVNLLFGLPILLFRFAIIFLPFEISFTLSGAVAGLLTFMYANLTLQVLRGIKVE